MKQTFLHKLTSSELVNKFRAFFEKRRFLIIYFPFSEQSTNYAAFNLAIALTTKKNHLSLYNVPTYFGLYMAFLKEVSNKRIKCNTIKYSTQ